VIVRLISELKRRNVLRMAVLYAVAAWLVMQVAEVLIGLADLPAWLGTATLAVLAVGFPIALIVSWFYELTPEGLALDKDVSPGDVAAHAGGRRANIVIIAMLSAAVILFAYDKWWKGPPPELSIAVMAFENMSADPEQEYFSDGIAEEILNVLAKFPTLDVRARSSSFSFKGKDIAIPAIAKQLNVAYVLEGSVRKAGDRLRITAQLIEASNDSHLWSEVYDRDANDVFAVQDEIATAISDALRLQLKADNGALPHVVKAANIGAYDAYLKGRASMRMRETENVRAAIREFRHALRLDDRFAPAHAQLAIATTMLGRRGEISLAEVMRTAAPHLERAQALEPGLAEMHAGWGELAVLEGDRETAIEHYRRALAASPRYGDALNWLWLSLERLGRYEEADALIVRALAVDPLDRVVLFNYAEWLCDRGRIDEARAFADDIILQDARWGNWIHANISMFYEGKLTDALSYSLEMQHHWWASRILAWVGEYAEARRMDPEQSYWVDADEGNWESAAQVWQERLRITPDDTETLVLAADIFMHTSRAGEALPLLEKALARAPDGRPIDHFLGHKATLELAELRRQFGDEEGAQTAARIVREDLAALRAAGRDNIDFRVAEATLAIFDKDFDRAIDSLGKAVERGLRDRNFHTLSSWAGDQLEGNPRFSALLEHLDSLIAEEHRKVLQLICFNNPTPDQWRPMPETCEGVADARGSG
jgi:TolB-like protein/thioredoxin-like negative regulator of GroEL